MQNLQSLLGVIALLMTVCLISENRRAIAWRQVMVSLALTFAAAVALLKLPGATTVFALINDAVAGIAAASRAGTAFVFGYLGGGELPYELKVPGAEFVLALQALPVVLVMSALTTLLFYGASCRPLCAACPGSSNARSGSAAQSASRPPPISLWAWWKRHCSSVPISGASRAASCSW